MSGTGSGAGDFKITFDFDRGVPGKGGHSDRGARVPSPVAKNLDHKIGSAVHYFGAVNETCGRIDEPAQTHDPGDLVEIAQSCLQMCQQVDRTGTGRLLSVLNWNSAAELALGHEFAITAKADLAGYHKHVAAAHEWHVVGNGTRGSRQRNADTRQFLFNRSGHSEPPPHLSWV